MEETPVAEVMPMEDVRPVVRVTMYESVSAAVEDGRRTKTATVDRHPTTPEATAMESRAATAEATAMKCRSAAAEAAAVETAATATEAAAMKTAAAATAKTATAHPAAVLNLSCQPVGRVFR